MRSRVLVCMLGLLGLVAGLVGVAILIGPGDLLGGGGVHRGGALVLVIGTASWAAGSLYARQAPRPTSPQLLSGMQMMSGGAILTHSPAMPTGAPASTSQTLTLSAMVAIPPTRWVTHTSNLPHLLLRPPNSSVVACAL